MKRQSSIIIVSAVALTAASNLLSLPTVHAAGPFTYGVVQDAGLAACLNGALGYTSASPISDIQLQSLPGSLSCSGVGIATLEGTQYLTGLTSLNLSGNQISDASPLSVLTNLTGLTLDANQISDLGVLSNLVTNSPMMALSAIGQVVVKPVSYGVPTDLSTLVQPLIGDQTTWHFMSGQVALSSGIVTVTGVGGGSLHWSDGYVRFSGSLTLTPVSVVPDTVFATCLNGYLHHAASDMISAADLGSLTGTVACTNWGVASVEGAQYLSGITTLDLSQNEIQDLSRLAGLIRLTSLSLTANKIIDVSPLSGLIGLTTLSAGGNQISDISSLFDLTNLASLSLGYNQISKVLALSGMTRLSTLILNDNLLTDISPLAGLVSLAYINLAYNDISDISAISGLTNLLTLRVPGNLITNVSPLANLRNLTYLDICLNQINDIGPLSGLVSLTKLDLYHNAIIDVGPLSGMTSLNNLDLGDNQVSNVAPLSSLHSLKYLTLYGNKISEVAPLANMTGLTYLDLDMNQIIDVSPLSSLVLAYPRTMNFSAWAQMVTITVPVGRPIDLAPLVAPLDGTQVTWSRPTYESSSIYSLSGSQLTLLRGTIGVVQWDDNMQFFNGIINLEPASIPVTSISVRPISVNVQVGTSSQLTAYISPSNATDPSVTWVSSDPKIATVDPSGNVTGVSIGTVTVTATAKDGFGAAGTTSVQVASAPSSTGVAMYRIFCPTTGEHFYTSSAKEANANVKSGAWLYEGVGWYAPKSGVPVYRLAAIPGSGAAGHLFTTSQKELNAALASTNPEGRSYWKCETGVNMPYCVGWYSGGSVPVYRAFYPGNGQHNYTTDSNEQRVITTQQGWNDEKIGWTGVQKGNPGAPLPAV